MDENELDDDCEPFIYLTPAERRAGQDEKNKHIWRCLVALQNPAIRVKLLGTDRETLSG